MTNILNTADELLRISKKKVTALVVTFMFWGLAGPAPHLFAAEISARPKIFGVAHYSTFVGNLAKARSFYEEFLGYEEVVTLPKPDGSPRTVLVKINDNQFVELVHEPNRGQGLLNNFALATDNVERMRRYLAARGVKVPAETGRDDYGNKMFSVTDPDGHELQFVEYLSDSQTGREAGKHLSSSRISNALMHSGILVGDLAAAAAFYGGILGCVETWRGNGTNGKALSWVNMRVPDGTNHVEFMLYKELPVPNQRGGQHHFCLAVPDMTNALATLEARRARKDYPREMKINVGVDKKRQISLRDPDGTRIELMEFGTVDGTPAPSSTLPPPRRSTGTNAMTSPDWTNSLGMIFVPVRGTDVKFSLWDTRVADYAAFAESRSGVDGSWRKVEFKGVSVSGGANHPVTMVNWNDAKTFCAWLTASEQHSGAISQSQFYRLPTDAEWSVAAGLKEEATGSPKEKSGKITKLWSWGSAWPPPVGAGNYPDRAAQARFADWKVFENYDDGFATTSPVGSFPANASGLFDMGGNVWQWCEDWCEASQKARVLRGGSWFQDASEKLTLSSRACDHGPDDRRNRIGFRVVLARLN